MLRSLVCPAAVLLMFLSPAAALDCTAVETAPGVKTRPAGCPDPRRAATPKKADDSRLKGSDGYIVTQDGTRIRVFGRVRTSYGVSR